jgi:hypothetical protein
LGHFSIIKISVLSFGDDSFQSIGLGSSIKINFIHKHRLLGVMLYLSTNITFCWLVSPIIHSVDDSFLLLSSHKIGINLTSLVKIEIKENIKIDKQILFYFILFFASM